MRIGEFAGMTGMSVSTLRHYDKEGLLAPDYIDNFTGYRYYSASQAERAGNIALLKGAGLSLGEIREALEHMEDREYVDEILNRREAECRSMLAVIKEVRAMMTEKDRKLRDEVPEEWEVVLEEDAGELLIKSKPLPQPLVNDDFQTACSRLEEEIRRRDLQRVSGFMTYGNPAESCLQVAAKAVRLEEQVRDLNEDVSLPFEDDEQVVGKWLVIGEYAVKEDFYSENGMRRESDYGNKKKELYFLPEGEDYWIYSWTKGYLKLQSGDQSCLCRYEVEEYQGRQYMFVENKSYEYRRGGRPTTLVLEQADHERYTRRGIAREEATNLPFVNDERVLGDWTAFDFIERKEEFSVTARHLPEERLMYQHMHFGEGGVFTSVYCGETMSGADKQGWTKGYVLKHYNHTVCAYEIVTVDSKDYMLIEWKSGDYRWGGYDTNYYVFIREGDA